VRFGLQFRTTHTVASATLTVSAPIQHTPTLTWSASTPSVSGYNVEIRKSHANFRMPAGCFLLLYGDSQRLHLAIKVGALEPENLGRAADIAVVFVQFLEDVVALVSGAGLMEGGELLQNGGCHCDRPAEAGACDPAWQLQDS
jgi:hypothetical protein